MNKPCRNLRKEQDKICILLYLFFYIEAENLPKSASGQGNGGHISSLLFLGHVCETGAKVGGKDLCPVPSLLKGCTATYFSPVSPILGHLPGSTSKLPCQGSLPNTFLSCLL